MAATASLVADGGEAAASEEHFFRDPAYLLAEGATHTIRVEGDDGTALIPVEVRDVEGGGRDAISPYGYPGGVRDGTAPDPGEIDWAPTGLVSLFVRDRIAAGPVLAGGTERGEVHLCDPERPSGVRKRLREQIRRNGRRGWATEVLAGPEAAGAAALFARAYRQTMERTGAAERYFFSDEYLATAIDRPSARLVIARRDGDGPVAAAIVARSDGLLHYFLGGTEEGALGDSPMKNVFAAMIELSEREGLPLHLGGGVEPGDSLDAFKRGFANRTERFVTHEVICDPDAYERLSAGRDAPPGFFPAYRAGAA